MRATVTYLSVLALPLPAYSFAFTLPASTPASARVRHPNHLESQQAHPRTHASYHGRGLRPQSVLMTHAVNLSTAVGTGEAVPMLKPQQEVPAAPTFDRSNLGFHLKIGSKVINLWVLRLRLLWTALSRPCSCVHVGVGSAGVSCVLTTTTGHTGCSTNVGRRSKCSRGDGECPKGGTRTWLLNFWNFENVAPLAFGNNWVELRLRLIGLSQLSPFCPFTTTAVEGRTLVCLRSYVDCLQNQNCSPVACWSRVSYRARP